MSRHPVLRAWLVFVVSLAALMQVRVWARPFTDAEFPRDLARLTAWTLRLLGQGGSADGTLVHSRLGTIEIIGECTAVYPTLILVAALIAVPGRPGRKLLGVALGVLAIQAVNLVRLVSLCYILRWYPAHFETAHLVVWQSLIVFFALLYWLVWTTGPGCAHES